MTPTTTSALLAIATFCNVFLLVFQQQNVHHGYLLLGSITSFALSICYVAIVLLTVEIKWASILIIGPAGIAGFLCSMFIHPFVRKLMQSRADHIRHKDQHNELIRRRDK